MDETVGTIEFDDSGFPIVRVCFVGTPTNEAFAKYLSDLDKMLKRNVLNATIVDARKSNRTPPLQRKMQAEWIRDHDRELRRCSAGTAFVITSPIVRGVLTAILWIQPLTQPHTVVSTMLDAELWAKEQLRKKAAAG